MKLHIIQEKLFHKPEAYRINELSRLQQCSINLVENILQNTLKISRTQNGITW